MKTTMTTNSFFQPEAFNDVLKTYFEKYFSSCEDTLQKACRYALFGSGKRVRPTLVFLAADFCDVEEAKIVPFAVAIELIHTYSLIHDDLPCMDNDDFRRGQPTVHKKFGEAIALLAGDALLNTAYQVLFDAIQEDPERIDGAKIICSAAGINGMIGGQSKEFVIEQPDFDEYMDITMKKTSALITASILSGASLCYDAQKKKALSTFAGYVGTCFQACDDLLDKDKKEKMSFVTIIGEEKTKELIHSLHNKATKTLSLFEEKGKNLLEYSEKLIKRTY